MAVGTNLNVYSAASLRECTDKRTYLLRCSDMQKLGNYRDRLKHIYEKEINGVRNS